MAKVETAKAPKKSEQDALIDDTLELFGGMDEDVRCIVLGELADTYCLDCGGELDEDGVCECSQAEESLAEDAPECREEEETTN